MPVMNVQIRAKAVCKNGDGKEQSADEGDQKKIERQVET